MQQQRGAYVFFLLALCLSTLITPIGINAYYFQETGNPGLSASLGLLVINFGFFIGFSKVNTAVAQRLQTSFGLLLLTGKLFVNTFTIFLLIGLQAVRTHVFVTEFLAGYSVLLTGGVIFLHWNSKRF